MSRSRRCEIADRIIRYCYITFRHTKKNNSLFKLHVLKLFYIHLRRLGIYFLFAFWITYYSKILFFFHYNSAFECLCEIGNFNLLPEILNLSITSLYVCRFLTKIALFHREISFRVPEFRLPHIKCSPIFSTKSTIQCQTQVN